MLLALSLAYVRVQADCLQLRLYSRERNLGASSLIYTERLPSSAVVIALVGQDTLLAYTYENVLYQYLINASSANVTLVQVGQIALHGIVRAPARVRAVSWILPDHQIRMLLQAGACGLC